ncbi:palmitoyltransferase ZDHHC5-like [Uloborus diversus]|uniref:palmitoyltransferase ZDHHC5-like n=1 Tax=Uloborus diversus TaxID=327109 RepID=UPI00240A1839|nr:palmitoyltransferase ZDHHC5-like [Uloborus diversus]
MSKCNPVTRIIPACFAWIILLLSTGAFFAFPCRYLMSVYSIAIPVVQGVITVFVIVNFTLATFVNPGVIPKATQDEIKGDGLGGPTYQDIEIHGVRVRLKWCVTCQFYRPPRCVHCGICDNCIETFDHHCPWVNNCIGRRNYRYFFMFLLWLSIHMISILGLCSLYIKDHFEDFKKLDTILTIVIVGIIIVLFIPIIGLTAYHTILIIQGRTTNEKVTGKFLDVPSPYTRGCCKNIIYSLCYSPIPRYKKKSSFYTSVDKYHRKGSGDQKETQAISPAKNSGGFKFVDQMDYSTSKQTQFDDESPPSYLNRGRLHLSLSESLHTKQPESSARSRSSRALTPPVPIRFDCSRRSLPPHNRLHAPSPHYVVAQSVHGTVFHTQRDTSKISACTSSHSSNPVLYYQNSNLYKYEYGTSTDACGSSNFYSHLYKKKDPLSKSDGFAFPVADAINNGKGLSSDTCCLGNQTVDKLQELANRTMMGGQCTDVSVLEAFPKGCSSFHNSPSKEHHDAHQLLIAQTPQQLFVNNCVECQQNSSNHSCQSSISSEFARTPGNRPLSFVKAMEMSEGLEWNPNDRQYSRQMDSSHVKPAYDIAANYKTTSPNSETTTNYKITSPNSEMNYEMKGQKNDHEISYEISV